VLSISGQYTFTGNRQPPTMGRMKSTFRRSLVFGASISFTIAAPAAESYSPKVGQVHPNFTLPRIDDRQATSLAEFRGKKVLLIHFASW